MKFDALINEMTAMLQQGEELKAKDRARLDAAIAKALAEVEHQVARLGDLTVLAEALAGLYAEVETSVDGGAAYWLVMRGCVAPSQLAWGAQTMQELRLRSMDGREMSPKAADLQARLMAGVPLMAAMFEVARGLEALEMRAAPTLTDETGTALGGRTAAGLAEALGRAWLREEERREEEDAKRREARSAARASAMGDRLAMLLRRNK